jgi:predicted DNA-binding protein
MKYSGHKPPSRIKYEMNNPTISIRVSKQLYQQLKMLRKFSGKSLGDILREALQKQGPSVKDAYNKGFDAAKAKYRIEFHCVFCGESIIIEDPDIKKAIVKYLKEQEWGHQECVDKHIQSS